MKIIIAPTSFKGTLSSRQTAAVMAEAAHEIFPDAEILPVPLSDGGEGTTETLVELSQGQYRTSIVAGPLPGQKVEARWGVLGDKETAVLEMASAAGLSLIPSSKCDPRITTTFGVGQLITHALNAGMRQIILGLGDSGTNDGGAGIVQALGVRLLDANGHELPQGGVALLQLDKIDVSNLDPRIPNTKIILACDVTNNLWGPEGASVVFSPQKGASMEDVGILDNALFQYGSIIRRDLGINVLQLPGSGAGGGAAAGLVAFCNAELRRGIELILDIVNFNSLIENATIVLTGEGKLDYQTQFGKVIHGVLSHTNRRGIPTIAVVGTTEENPEDIALKMHLNAVHRLIDEVGETDAIKDPKESLRRTTIHALQKFTNDTHLKLRKE
ncbi:MAG: glycerate kinase [Bacteroidota bacterium]